METSQPSASVLNRLTRRSSLLLVLAGLLVVILAGLRVWQDYRTFYSPLDQVDIEQGQDQGLALEQGFIPVYAQEDGSINPGNAPTLPVGGVALAMSAQTTSEPSTPESATPGPTAPAAAPPAARAGTDQLPFPTPSSTPPPVYIPDRLVIPAIDLDAPIVPALVKQVEVNGQVYEQWVAPNKFAAGWHETSAPLHAGGNTVLNGHHNMAGEVFRELYTLKEGDQIFVYSGGRSFVYRVEMNLILKERFQPVEVRLQNAAWILPSQDERLTLISCWPYESNTHRVVIVALPVAAEDTRQ
jgi:sortase A